MPTDGRQKYFVVTAFIMKLPKPLDEECPRAVLVDRNKAFNTRLKISGGDARSTL